MARMAPRILITGGTGRLGRELVRMFPNSLHPPHSELDMTNADSVKSFIRLENPQVVIHCAAMTGIRECESDKEKAWLTNVVGTSNLVRACEESRGLRSFVFISTACVFHGDRGGYTETDIPYPKNFYSTTKLQSEAAVAYSGLRKWLIIRTNFVAREKWPYKRAFTDRFGTYLFADDVARAIVWILSQSLIGIVHVCGEKKMSMFQLAKMTAPEVQPMNITDYEGPPLTMDMCLKSIRIKPFKISRESGN
jgi:dTDP-4-dehydrorhamnose reductase